VATILALERQQHREFEAVVVVDGSTDGTAAALRALNPSFALTVIEQDNQGRAAAVNRGVRAAGEEIVLILDDDMEADPALLSEHQRSRLEGADWSSVTYRCIRSRRPRRSPRSPAGGPSAAGCGSRSPAPRCRSPICSRPDVDRAGGLRAARRL